MSIKHTKRYVQIAFNGTFQQMLKVLPQIPADPRIIIEAGTPYIKLYGMEGVRAIRKMWRGLIVADLKISDGAIEEVRFAVSAGANAVTVMGSAPVETLDFVNAFCAKLGVYSMIDMLGVDKPLRKLLPLKHKPDFVVIHKGRDEESNKKNIIRYKDIAKIRSKYETFISVAGGLDYTNVRKAFFNGAGVAILNIVSASDPNNGILDTADFNKIISHILNEIGE